MKTVVGIFSKDTRSWLQTLSLAMLTLFLFFFSVAHANPTANPLDEFIGCYDAVSYNGESLSPSEVGTSEIRMVPEGEFFAAINGTPIPSLRVTARILGPQGEYERSIEMLVGSQKFSPITQGAQVTYEDTVLNKLSGGPYHYGFQMKLVKQSDGTLLILKIELDCNCPEKMVLRPRSCG